MTGSSLSADADLLLAFCAATLIVAALTLRNARRSVELAEYCAQYLHKEQERLLALLSEERRMLREELEREWEQHLMEIRRRGERSSRELLMARREQARLAEELRQERAKYLEAQQQARQEGAKHLEARQWVRQEREGRERERRARLETEARIEQLEQEIRKLQEAQRQAVSPVSAGVSDVRVEAARLPGEEPTRGVPEAGRTMPPASGDPEARPEPAKAAPQSVPRDKKPGLGVWHPHPDDGAAREKARPAVRGGAPVEMYRKHYDKYLENYRGYVELAEELCRMRDSGEVASGSLGEAEWEQRLRRVKDGLRRTTARLDILEQHNPELVTDARISHRASVARRHAQLP